jgi:hypothetical protein
MSTIFGLRRVTAVCSAGGCLKRKNARESIATEGTLEEMRIDLNRLVSLLQVNRLNRILGLVSGGQHLER